MNRLALLLPLAVAAFALAGCGGSGSSSTTAPPAPTTASAAPATTTTAATGSPGSLQAEANAAATGDIPDNQVFLTFRDTAGGFSIKYPEGWAQNGAGKNVLFRDKNNIVRVVIGSGGAATPTQVHSDVASLAGATIQHAPARMTISGKPAIKVTYTTQSAPNAVTGKRVTLVVDRYYLWNGSRRAVVDLGTPQGVDNVDAYRMMIESFRWS